MTTYLECREDIRRLGDRGKRLQVQEAGLCCRGSLPNEIGVALLASFLSTYSHEVVALGPLAYLAIEFHHNGVAAALHILHSSHILQSPMKEIRKNVFLPFLQQTTAV